MAATVKIDPSGEVELVCLAGFEDETRPRVYSAVLRLCSAVFKSMLGVHFKEGKELATSTVDIPLPDDDALAMELLCNALHHPNRAIHLIAEPQTADLVRIAELSDKYEKKDLVTASYYFRKEVAYRTYVRRLVMNSVRSIWKTASDDDEHPLRKVFQSLESERLRFQHQIVAYCEKQLQSRLDIRNKYLEDAFTCSWAENCTFPEGFAADFLRQLRDLNLLPSSTALDQSNRTLLHSMKSVKDVLLETCATQGGRRCLRGV